MKKETPQFIAKLFTNAVKQRAKKAFISQLVTYQKQTTAKAERQTQMLW